MMHDLLADKINLAVTKMSTKPRIHIIPSVQSRVRSIHKKWIVNETPKFFMKLGGKKRIEYPGGEIVLKGNDILIFGAQIPHKETRLQAKGDNIELVINFRDDKIQAIISGRKDYCKQNNIPSRLHLNNHYRPALLELLRTIALYAGEFTDKEKQHLLTTFILLVRNAYKTKTSDILRHPLLVEKALRLIQENKSDSSFNIQIMAKLLDCSYEHLSRKFKQSTGEAPISYLKSKRLELAENILVSQGALNISEVAYMCGFSSPGYFCNCFMKKYKITADEYRRIYTLK